jgi:hypothetical protein
VAIAIVVAGSKASTAEDGVDGAIDGSSTGPVLSPQ